MLKQVFSMFSVQLHPRIGMCSAHNEGSLLLLPRQEPTSALRTKGSPFGFTLEFVSIATDHAEGNDSSAGFFEMRGNAKPSAWASW